MAQMKQKMTKYGEVIYFNYVPFKPSADGELLYVWDIDKTYLDTRFETFRGLLRTAFEKAFQKVNVPGTATLLRALQTSQKQPLYFISASPPQMENKIAQKMTLDRIYPYGIFFKDNLKNFRPRKFKRLKHQVGFKVQSLLEMCVLLEKKMKLILFGDDSESDAVVYSLFSDICKRRMSQSEIGSVLEALHVLPEQRKRIFDLQAKLPEYDPVYKIYINLVNDTDPDYYAKFGRRVLATFTTFQAALDLFQDALITEEQLIMVARDMCANYGFTPEELAQNFNDLAKRSFLRPALHTRIIAALKEQNLLPPKFSPALRPTQALQQLGQQLGEKLLGLELEDPMVMDHIDYLHDFR